MEHFRYRILVPYLAKPLYWLAKDRVGSWHPILFALLVVNAIFTATAACLLVLIGQKILGSYHIGLVGALLYLLNFNVSNTFLASGLVDSAEACLMLVVAWVLFADRWAALPFIAPAGALAKETFVPFSIVFTTIWLAVASRKEGQFLLRLQWVVAMGAIGLTTITVLQSQIVGHLLWPWDIA